MLSEYDFPLRTGDGPLAATGLAIAAAAIATKTNANRSRFKAAFPP
jgi:hypothetical protein